MAAFPSMVALWSKSLTNARTRVLFPHPFGPTMATFSPWRRKKLIFCNTTLAAKRNMYRVCKACARATNQELASRTKRQVPVSKIMFSRGTLLPKRTPRLSTSRRTGDSASLSSHRSPKSGPSWSPRNLSKSLSKRLPKNAKVCQSIISRNCCTKCSKPYRGPPCSHILCIWIPRRILGETLWPLVCKAQKRFTSLGL